MQMLNEYILPDKPIENFTQEELNELSLWYLTNKQRGASFTYCVLLQSRIDELKNGEANAN